MSAEPLVSIELIAGIARADGALDPGTVIEVRPDIAKAWIADGLARPAGSSRPPAADPGPWPRSRARG
jgi:hypothetical protein